MTDFKCGAITEKIIGAAFRVHGTLGNGFQDVIYQRAVAIELNSFHIVYAREFEMPIYYIKFWEQTIGISQVYK